MYTIENARAMANNIVLKLNNQLQTDRFTIDFSEVKDRNTYYYRKQVKEQNGLKEINATLKNCGLLSYSFSFVVGSNLLNLRIGLLSNIDCFYPDEFFILKKDDACEFWSERKRIKKTLSDEWDNCKGKNDVDLINAIVSFLTKLTVVQKSNQIYM